MEMNNKPYINKIKEKKLSVREITTRGKICQYFGHIFTPAKNLGAVVASAQYQSKKQKPLDVYDEKYLPFYLNNQNWMANYIAAVIEQHEPNYKVNVKDVEDFISDSTAYASVRNYYKSDLVAANVKYLLQHHENLAAKPDFDKNFRKEVLWFMNHVDIDAHTIESYLEKHAALWREQVMSKTFENKYLVKTDLINQHNKLWLEYFENFKKAHKKVWMKQREYDYYQDHKAVLDELGSVTKNMKISKHQAELLNNKLNKFEKKFERLLTQRNYKKSILQVNRSQTKQEVVQRQVINPNGVMLKRKDDIEKNV